MRRLSFSKDAMRTLEPYAGQHGEADPGKFDQYAVEPATLANNVKALRGFEGVYRLRIGDWRVVFSDDGTVIAVIRIAPRGGAYD